ncbi:hypothetical protein NSQ26_04935 [Bacillus sp. FSL W7-1360]
MKRIAVYSMFVASLLFVSGCLQSKSVFEPINWNEKEQRLLMIGLDGAVAFKTAHLKETVKGINVYLDVYENGELNENESRRLYESVDPATERHFAYKFAKVPEGEDLSFSFFTHTVDNDGTAGFESLETLPYSNEIFVTYATAGGLDADAEKSPLFLWSAYEGLHSEWYTDEGIDALRETKETFVVIGIEWVHE